MTVSKASAVSEWRTCRIEQWNERLLEHFFRRREESEPPVVSLLVTPDELKRAIGDVGADETQVRDAFIDAVLRSVPNDVDLLDEASNYREWPKPPPEDATPRFVAHLVFTCIAASESTEELADENSYIARLKELARGRSSGGALKYLPKLWENLADWLNAGTNGDRYRPLLLPNPGGFTRIGYSVMLAFPDRRDQKELAALLDAAGFVDQEPPPGKVLSLIADQRDRFRRRFLEEFDDFRIRFAKSVGNRDGSLWRHRLWCAVRDAALRGRGAAELPDLRGSVQLLGADEDGVVGSFVVSDDPLVDARGGLTTLELPISRGRWRFAVFPRPPDNGLDADSMEASARALLCGAFKLPKLSSLVEQGVLPFVEATHGLLELAGAECLDETTVILARETVVADLVRLFDGSAAHRQRSSYEGWIQLNGLRLRQVPSEKLEGTTLARCWSLHESLAPISIRLVGGIRVGDGWLGLREILPRIIVAGATHVDLEVPDGTVRQLGRDKNGEWLLPPEDHSGELRLAVRSSDGSAERRTIRFVSAPTSEEYKAASDPAVWIVEGLGGTGDLSAPAPFSATASTTDAEPLSERILYLGPVVGQFVDTPDEAAWKIVRFGERNYASREREDLAKAPIARTGDSSARRRWKKLLLNAEPDLADPGFAAAREAVRRRLRDDLPHLDLPGGFIPFEAQPRNEKAAAVERLVAVLSSRASARSGISISDWTSLMRKLLDVEPAIAKAVTRAWMETGLVDVASYAHWWQRSVFARAPSLVTYKVGRGFGGTLLGLALETTREAVREAATRRGAVIDEHTSVSALVPPTFVIRFAAPEEASSIAAEAGIGTYWLDLSLEAFESQVRFDGTSHPPGNYETKYRWTDWSLATGRSSADVVVDHWMRRDRPDYWVATRGASTVWSYDLNVVRCWAAVLSGESPVLAKGKTEIEVVHAYLPLPLARVASALGVALPGPDANRNSVHRYVFASSALRDRLIEVLRLRFDLGRLSRVSTTE